MSHGRFKELIKEFNEKFAKLTVKGIIEILTDFKVWEFDLTKEECGNLKNDLLNVANNLINDIQSKGGQEFDPEPESNLRTEISSWFQREVEERVRMQTKLSINSLGWAGYPRFEIDSGYLTIKTMRSTTGSSPRYLYLSPRGLKVEKSGYHLGLVFIYDLETTEDIPNVYPNDVRLVDLSKVELSTKIECSASSKKTLEARI